MICPRNSLGGSRFFFNLKSIRWHQCDYNYQAVNIRISHDRKLCHEEHRLASRALPSDDKRWSWGMDFSIPSSHNWLTIHGHHWIPIFFEKINSKKCLNALRCDITRWRHFDITMTSLDDNVRELQYNQYVAFTWLPVCDTLIFIYSVKDKFFLHTV